MHICKDYCSTQEMLPTSQAAEYHWLADAMLEMPHKIIHLDLGTTLLATLNWKKNFLLKCLQKPVRLWENAKIC